MRTRRGFTLIETLIVAVIGIFLMISTYRVLVLNQQTYTTQAEQVRAQRSTAAGLAVLFAELREVSSRGGDILGFADDSIAVRVMRSYGAACQVNLGSTPQLVVWSPAGDFSMGDSVVVFADNDETLTSDDVWIRGIVTGSSSLSTCGSLGATSLSFAGQGPTFDADTVRVGAPVRAFERMTYGLFTIDGDAFLGRRSSDGELVPLIGPLAPASGGKPGLEFAYYDSTGAVTTVPADVREIRVTLRTLSEVPNRLGEPVQDSLSASIDTRN